MVLLKSGWRNADDADFHADGRRWFRAGDDDVRSGGDWGDGVVWSCGRDPLVGAGLGSMVGILVRYPHVGLTPCPPPHDMGRGSGRIVPCPVWWPRKRRPTGHGAHKTPSRF